MHREEKLSSALSQRVKVIVASWVPKQQLPLLMKQKCSFLRLEISKPNHNNVQGIHTAFVVTTQRHDQEFDDKVFAIYLVWYS